MEGESNLGLDTNPHFFSSVSEIPRSRVPVTITVLAGDLHCLALDFPGFGHSGGELEVAEANVRALARIVLDAADALGLDTFAVAAHDICGAVAQYLAAHTTRVTRLVLINSVMFDSWPVPAVERFRDPAVRAATSAEELLAARTKTMQLTVERPLSPEELDEYVLPWRSPARARSWMAMVAAADSFYTLDLLPSLKRRPYPQGLSGSGTTTSRKSASPAATSQRSLPAT